jgi:seryl-tRNA synthetase
MIDLVQLRREPEMVKTALARRGVSTDTMDEILALDAEHRRLLQEAEGLRADINDLSRQVGEAHRSKQVEAAQELTARSRALGDLERQATEATEATGAMLREMLLMIPNLPAPDVPEGRDENDNVELRRWWVGMEEGLPAPTYQDYQTVPHWEVGAQLGILDVPALSRRRGPAPAGSGFFCPRPPHRGLRGDTSP